MALTEGQIQSAFREISAQMESEGALSFTKQELKQAVTDAEAWADSAPVKSSFNNGLTVSNFKTNATPDQKRLTLIWALWSIIKG